MPNKEYWSNYKASLTVKLDPAAPRLSKAILDGCKIYRKQTTGEFFEGNGQIKACALGAAYVGLGYSIEVNQYTNTKNHVSMYPIYDSVRIQDTLEKEFKAYDNMRVIDPLTKKSVDPLLDLVVDLNDKGWTRERIARFVQKAEHNYLSKNPIIYLPFSFQNSVCTLKDFSIKDKPKIIKEETSRINFFKNDIIYMNLNGKKCTTKVVYVDNDSASHYPNPTIAVSII